MEFDVSGADVLSLRRELALESHVHGVDIAVAPAGLARRGRRLVVMDVDSTLIQDEVIELPAAHAGREDEVAADRGRDGELDFAQSLRERVAVLKGLPVEVLDEVRAAVQFTAGARTRANPETAGLHRCHRVRRVHRDRRRARPRARSTTPTPTASKWSTATSPAG